MIRTSFDQGPHQRRQGTLERGAFWLEQGGDEEGMTCTDSVLQGLLLPALAQFMPNYPALTIELSTSGYNTALWLLTRPDLPRLALGGDIV
jgi:DNA-binding transcriptional LysR family regulator